MMKVIVTVYGSNQNEIADPEIREFAFRFDAPIDEDFTRNPADVCFQSDMAFYETWFVELAPGPHQLHIRSTSTNDVTMWRLVIAINDQPIYNAYGLDRYSAERVVDFTLLANSGSTEAVRLIPLGEGAQGVDPGQFCTIVKGIGGGRFCSFCNISSVWYKTYFPFWKGGPNVTVYPNYLFGGAIRGSGDSSYSKSVNIAALPIAFKGQVTETSPGNRSWGYVRVQELDGEDGVGSLQVIAFSDLDPLEAMGGAQCFDGDLKGLAFVAQERIKAIFSNKTPLPLPALGHEWDDLYPITVEYGVIGNGDDGRNWAAVDFKHITRSMLRPMGIRQIYWDIDYSSTHGAMPQAASAVSVLPFPASFAFLRKVHNKIPVVGSDLYNRDNSLNIHIHLKKVASANTVCVPWVQVEGYPEYLPGTFWNGVLLNDEITVDYIRDEIDVLLSSVPVDASMAASKKVRVHYGHYVPGTAVTGQAFVLAQRVEDPGSPLELSFVEPLFISPLTLEAIAPVPDDYDARVNSASASGLVPPPDNYDVNINSATASGVAPAPDPYDVNINSATASGVAPVPDSYDASINSATASGITPPQCSQYTSQAACEANDCYWYDNSCHSSPDPDKKATLNGVVRSMFGVMGGATVTLDGKSAVTAGDGSFSITGIAKGTYTLTIQPAGLFGFFLRPYVTDYSITYPTTYNEEFSLSLDPIKAGMLLGGIGLGVGGVIAVSTGKKKDGGGGGKGYGFR